MHYNNELDKKQPEKVESCGQILAQAKVAEGQITPSSKWISIQWTMLYILLSLIWWIAIHLLDSISCPLYNLALVPKQNRSFSGLHSCVWQSVSMMFLLSDAKRSQNWTSQSSSIHTTSCRDFNSSEKAWRAGMSIDSKLISPSHSQDLVCDTFLSMLVLRTWWSIKCYPLVNHFLYPHELSTWYCADIV